MVEGRIFETVLIIQKAIKYEVLKNPTSGAVKNAFKKNHQEGRPWG